MIKNISAKNFKAFENIEMDIRPITLIVGPNNSGKSSALAIPRILSQTLQSYDNNIPLLLNGYLGDFGTYKDITFGNITRRGIEIKISASKNPSSNVNSTFFKRSGLDANAEIEFHFKYKYRSKFREIVLKEIIIESSGKNVITITRSDDSENYVINTLNNVTIPTELRSSISKNIRVFNFLPKNLLLGYEMHTNKKVKDLIADETLNITRALGYICDILHKDLIGMEYLGAMRSAPLRSYLYSGEKHSKVGISGENSANILAMDDIKGEKKTKNIISKISDWLNKAGIASDLKINHLSDRHYEIKIQHPVTKEYENYADVGYGNSQIIPVLTAGYNMNTGNMLIIEEPEIHLHPKAQAELASFFLDMYQDNKTVIAETHSEHLIVRLQQYIASQIIPEKDIVIYYSHFIDDKKSLIKIELNELGNFTQPWPEGFFPQRLEEAKALAKARHNRSS
ncbi:AAA family ATPase [Pectobacterium versatile]|uniref:AAA family ATPase n=1 Tax=Pectobacterium versatile TaxID=2488639 RepID=UPI001CF48BDF|nr:AAA family ATPase [Pectobacterium versatile]UCP82115.1 AAA family ATPase [Pectobacterium versatile]